MSNTVKKAGDSLVQSRSECLRQIDFDHIWHPFTQSSQWFADCPLIVDRAEGFYLYDPEGKDYLDGVSSLWCNVHGHSHPAFTKAGKEQVENLVHSTMLGLSHSPIIECTERLVSLLPAHLSRVFYSDSGTSAVEAAIRISLEWWQKQGGEKGKQKTKLLSLAGAYHGDTLGAVGIGFLDFFHGALNKSVVQSHRVRTPHIFRFEQGYSESEAVEKSVFELKEFLSQEGDSIAAFFVEPLVQGAAGIWVYPPEYLKEIETLCRNHDIHLIVDEVATGFGKTGQIFAHQIAGVEADLLVMGKGLSGGLLAISAVACREEIFRGFHGKPSEGKTFFYGQTFAGNPLAARFAEVNLSLFQDPALMDGARKRIDKYTGLLDQKLKTLDWVDEVRQLGFMTGIELTSKPGSRAAWKSDQQVGVKIVKAARDRGVFIRPLGNVIVLMPAIAMPEEDLEKLVQVTAEAIDEACSSES